MINVGIDIGTSKICVVALDKQGNVILSFSIKNYFDFDKEQNADRIVRDCFSLLNKVKEKIGEPSNISISNQMHGILYVDKQGNAVSNLYTWLDEKGNQKYQDTTYVDYVVSATGHHLLSGYGLVTHFYLQENGLIPKEAQKIMTIGDYLALKLLNMNEIVMHPSNAASLGLYKIEDDEFDIEALHKLNISPSFLPKVSYSGQRIMAYGDNQCSFLGAVENIEDSIFVNIGTGAQITTLSNDFKDKNCGVRPFFKNKKILVGAIKWGGLLYAKLGEFFLSNAQTIGIDATDNIYEYMSKECNNDSSIQLDASILNNVADDELKTRLMNSVGPIFTARDLIVICQKSIIKELHDQFLTFGIEKKVVVGAGNALRKNPLMQNYIKEFFGLPLIMNNFEEAAIGAIKYSLLK